MKEVLVIGQYNFDNPHIVSLIKYIFDIIINTTA